MKPYRLRRRRRRLPRRRQDDRTFAYGDDAGALFIADLSVADPPSVFDTRRPGINELAYSKDGLLAVAAGPGTAGEVFLFD